MSYQLEIANGDPTALFELIEILEDGQYGGFGQVYKSVHVSDRAPVAIKIVKGDINDYVPYIEALQQCSSQHVVAYRAAYRHKNEHWLIFEFCDAGSLSHLMSACDTTLSEDMIAIACKHLLLALSELHSKGLMHRDVQCSNVLLHSSGDVKLGMFGFDLPSERPKLPYWMAPEVLKEIVHQPCSDIWSLGITAYEMAIGAPPLADLNPTKAIFTIPSSKVPAPTLPDSQQWSSEFRDFLSKCLVKDPQSRATAAQLLTHPFVTNCKPQIRICSLITDCMPVIQFHRKPVKATSSSSVDLQQLKANAVANAYRNLPLIVTADIGGTNARLQLWRRETTGAAALAFRQVYRPSAFPSLVVLLRTFIADCAAALQVPILPTVCCLAICGPVWGQGRFNESNNIPAWCPAGKAYCYHDAADIERSLALSAQSVRFLNDFEAIGYCIAAHLDDQATLPAKPSPAPRVLRAGEPDAGPHVLPGAAAACVGAGTGLGCCIVVPAASADPNRLAFNVVPSEAGMAESVCPRSEREWRLLQYLRRINQDESYVEIERIVSGPGLADVCQFLHSECVANRESDLKALTDAELKRITDADVEDRPAIVTELARAGNALCLAALDIFLSFYGRALGAVALSVLPTRCGLYIAGGILPKLAWHVPCLGGSAPTDALLEGFLQLGPKMSGVVARVPLLLMDDGDVGVKGCLFVALGMLPAAVKKP